MLVTSRLTPQFRYDTRANRYRAGNGAFVARETVKAASEAIGTAAQRGIEEASTRFQNGEINHAQWHAAMRGHIRDLHVSQSALASGGWDAMTQRDWGRAGADVKEQYQFLNGMGERIQSGYYGDDLSRNGFLAHARMYGQAGRLTFERTQAMNAAEDLGHDEVRNQYGANEHHCEGPGSCAEIDALGWIAVDSDAFRDKWKWPGERTCVTQDKCRVLTRKSK